MYFINICLFFINRLGKGKFAKHEEETDGQSETSEQQPYRLRNTDGRILRRRNTDSESNESDPSSVSPDSTTSPTFSNKHEKRKYAKFESLFSIHQAAAMKIRRHET